MFASFSSFANEACDHVGAYIVNLSQDAADKIDPNVCTSKIIHSQIRACIAQKIKDNIDDECQSHIDIFVPGTAAEHGAWKQFNHIFNSDNNRAHLSLQYDDDRTIEGATNFDGALYDQGVKDARLSLILLLDALKLEFSPAPVSIRVFGHSKGSHPVAMVSLDGSYDDVEFYAFAQAGRTEIDIDGATEIVPAPLGTPGQIEKLGDNLVGITWKNDEVQYYTGFGTSGIHFPEIWSFPGYIWQEGGGDIGNPFAFHMDHHNNYGGLYTDGIAGNNWRQGQGTVSENFGYCATGDQYIAFADPACDKQKASKAPYFWGTPECRAEAFRMMARGKVGDKYDIGYSGPREPGTCQMTNKSPKVKAKLRWQFNLPDKDCVYSLRFGFTDIRGGELDSFTVSGTTANDQQWHTKEFDIFVPWHMQLNITAKLTQDSQGGVFPNCDSLAESEAYIDYLDLSFASPGTGNADKRRIIGFREGRGVLGDLHKHNNVAWEQISRSSGELKMYYDPIKHVIKIEGPTKPNYDGKFRKRVHVLD